MDPEAKEFDAQDDRARHARRIIFVVMAVFIAVPVILYVLASGGFAPRP